MTPEGRYAAVLEVLELGLNEPGKPVEQILQGYTRSRRFIGSKDRRFIAELLFDLMRSRARLGWHVARVAPHLSLSARLWLFSGLILKGDLDLEELSSLCSGEGYAPALLSPSERFVLEALEPGAGPDHDEMPTAVRTEVPEWLWSEFERSFPAETVEQEALALLEAAPVVLRVNSLKLSRDEARALLRKEGFETEETGLSAWGLILSRRGALNQTAAYRNGLVELQDESSQLFVAETAVEPGMTVLDLCAGAGGKTLALAAAMNNEGRLLATDIAPARLQKSKPRLERAEASIAKTGNFPAIVSGPEFRGAFDRVVVDAPCSGTGTWRRQPDSRWRLTAGALAEYRSAQSGCLDQAADLVKPGGWLCYATCSVLKAENEDQVAAFLARRPDFAPAREPFLKLSPARQGTDGFFGAMLVRKD
ncbi:RsmB/NOP family class I SAM-dependent RNA methyltransferase [Kiloniella sp. b19]|uniref:RsmB/NOP family class I SAM-dependent RNA methyltransferase n=1 Tax=Kiloniella sp. GXU_MW_B19 TaxID=3141326 RepID=UPI0031D33AAE